MGKNMSITVSTTDVEQRKKYSQQTVKVSIKENSF